MSSDGARERHWPPQGPLHRPELVRLGSSVAVRAECDDIPAYGYGYSYIYGVSPDFAKRIPAQEGSTAPTRKVVPKKTWELEDNMLGMTPARMPRTARSDIQPWLEVHLIDGDHETYWACRGQLGANVEPAWARIDLPKETTVRSIRLIPREDGEGFPKSLEVKVSCDGCTWDTVYASDNIPDPDGGTPVEFTFSPRRVKQVWVVGSNLPLIHGMHMFSLAGIEVIDDDGDNVALISRGSSVLASSFEPYIACYRESHQWLWPTHYDLGAKWVRINYAGSVLNWHFVEREKGHYEIDPEADAAITQAVENGCRIVFGLGFTNWLYTPEGHPDPKQEKQLTHTAEFSVPFPRPDVPGMLDGFKNFVRFMVEHYKDRVDYFEIWNEQSAGYGGWSNTPGSVYTEYMKAASPIIKEVHPGAKVVLGSLSGFGPRREVGLDWLQGRLDEGIAPHVDAIAFHGYYGCGPDDDAWKNFVSDINEAKAMTSAHGFHGLLMHSEYCNFAPYPEPKSAGLEWTTELAKAKEAARFAIINMRENVHFMWNETWCDGHIERDVGLFRNAFSGTPVSPSQPQPIYYVFRTLSTMFENATPSATVVRIDPTDVQTEVDVECSTFAVKGGDLLVALSLAGKAQDESPEVVADVSIVGERFSSAVAVDLLNGEEQDVAVDAAEADTRLARIVLRDYPLIIRLTR